MISPVDLILAMLLDVMIGTPEQLPHPVRWIGRLIKFLERVMRRIFKNERLGGVATVIMLITITAMVVGLVIRGANALGPVVGHIAVIIITYLGFASRCLFVEGRRIYQDLERKDIVSARLSVARIVGRDTRALDETGVSRAAIESIAENTVDGIISPLFFAVIGGPVGLWIFKTVSTADSMIGHMDARYIRFGTAAARLDDILNWIPARLSFVLFPVAAILTGNDAGGAWRIARRDHDQHASPNAGVPEAAIAGALGVQLGGPLAYDGHEEVHPYFGAGLRMPTADDLRRALMMLIAVTTLAFMTVLVGNLFMFWKIRGG